MNASETQELIVAVCDEVKEILIEKNRKYGNSALQPARIFSKSSAVEQINVRIDDKLNRKMNQQDDEDEDIDLDLIGYLILKRVWTKMQEPTVPEGLVLNCDFDQDVEHKLFPKDFWKQMGF